MATVPGTAKRVVQAVRDRLAAALAATTALEPMGQERVTPLHFNLDPTLARNRWYRLSAPSGFAYLTVRLNHEGKVTGVVVEEE